MESTPSNTRYVFYKCGLNITTCHHIGVASFAQQRLWMDEQVRFHQSINELTSVYNELLIFKLSSITPFSISRLRRALSLVIAKHSVLRTALVYQNDKLIQKVLSISCDIYNLEVTHVISDIHVRQVLHDEETNRSLFDLEKGRVFRCHVLLHLSNNENDCNLKENDLILFNFHHSAIDGSSIPIFINDLRQALSMKELSYNSEDNITYLDYAQYERLEDWSNTRQYWNNIQTTLNNSINQPNSSVRTGKGYTITFDLDHDLIVNLNHFIFQSNLTLFQVGLAAFLAFLFKMSNSQQLDMCTNIIVANRFHYQLQNMIGFFANTLPFALKINPHESFTKLCRQIQQHWLDILPHSHLPYQNIVELNPQLTSSLLQTLFLVETTKSSSELNIELDDGTTLGIIDRNLLAGNIAKFDITCTLHEHRQNETISVSLNASLDLYDESTISTMGDRLKKMFDQLFSVPTICQFSLLLPDELELMHDLNDTFVDYGHIGCIHWDFAYQTELYPQKVALIQENASMTYAELLYHSQQLANYLITEHGVQPGRTVCQLIERSFEMVIGMISIWMSGGIYAPLNLHDSLEQVNKCGQQTDAHLILVHQPTHVQTLSGGVAIKVDQIICSCQINEEIMVNIDSVNVTSDHIAYIICTSDFSGLLKPVSRQ